MSMIDITERDYDLLVDTEIIVDVILGDAELTVRDFLNLSEGDIISLNKDAGSGGDIYVNTRIVGTGDIIVMDEKLAVRVQDAMDSDNVVRYFFEEQMI
ncbi:FliM/FliN family flagellar motor switch protein [Candidatus Marinarcus aquaticus]|uniref:FliM/FliN family flagellar motor switch protein n=1 Tax=Candidatus Marinarcus aquaticus TaxID=2044504 RepID=UPI001D17240B|nr:FliM/FliN family flagellar motor switch protein [Candidatus Marinarcus aquaticus]